MLQAIEQAKIGDVVPVYKVIESVDLLEYFAKLSDYGRNKHSILLEFNFSLTIYCSSFIPFFCYPEIFITRDRVEDFIKFK